MVRIEYFGKTPEMDAKAIIAKAKVKKAADIFSRFPGEATTARVLYPASLSAVMSLISFRKNPERYREETKAVKYKPLSFSSEKKSRKVMSRKQ